MVFEGGIFIEQIALCLEVDYAPRLEELELIIDQYVEGKADRRMRGALLCAARALCSAKGVKLTVTEVDY